MRRRYLTAYDVSDSERLRAVERVMLGYGSRLQYSVFLCDLSEAERILLVQSLLKEINIDQDRVVIVDLGSAEGAEARFEFLGKPIDLPKSDTVVV